MHFNNLTHNVEYQTANTSTGISFYNNGVEAKAGNFYSSSLLKYKTAGNILSNLGSVEAWVRPNWSGNDGKSRTIFSWGVGGGMILVKDGAGYLKIIINRYGSNSAGNEISVGTNVNSWTAGTWHHVACSWSNNKVELYLNGQLVSSAPMSYTPPPISASTFFVGSDNGNSKWEGQIDEVRFSKVQRFDYEILKSYEAGSDGVTHDHRSTIILRFNDNLTKGEVLIKAVQNTGVTYAQGILNKCALFNGNEVLKYNSNWNIRSDKGTFEGWVKPTFNPEPGGGDHTILRWGSGGGILLFINGGSTLRFIVNRFSTGGNPEININYDIQEWDKNDWHHLAVTWSSTKLELFIDGIKVSESATGYTLPTITDTQFFLGSDAGVNKWAGYFDEFRITNTQRTEDEIANSFFRGINLSSLTLKENNIEKFPHWRYRPEVCGVSGGQTFDIPSGLLDWSSSNNYIASVDDGGIVHFHNPSNVSLTGSVDGLSVQLNVIVKDAIIDPKHPSIDPFMATPAECAKEEMKVLVVCYFPTQDGVNLDTQETGPDLGGGIYPLNNIENLVDDYSIMMKHMLEERTKFRGYKNPDADPYLGYEVIDFIQVYEPLPRFLKVPFDGDINLGTINYMDVPKIGERFDFESYVDNEDVDEIWIWGYHNDTPDGIFGWESEMSSPTTGSISNSHSLSLDTDLPVYSKTYTVYGFNYGRTPSLHNQGHQLESIFKFIDFDFFQEKFVGAVNNNPPLGRAGDTHFPPNTTQAYDYYNPTLVASDIEDWEPNGGPTKLVNVDTWGSLDYNWPYDNTPPGEPEVNYYIYWMQNMPGYLNKIPYNGNYMTNWWEFVANWDEVNNNNMGLYANSQSPIASNDACAADPCPLFSSHSFENGMQSWIDGGSDCHRVAGYAKTGTYSIRLRDDSGVNSTLSSAVHNWSGVSSLVVDFSFFPRSMEANEDFWLQVSTNGGASYTTVDTWKSGTDFNNNIRYNEKVVINDVDFTENSRVRFRCDASGDGDYIYLDDIKITTCHLCPTIDLGTFENGWGIWNDGGSDCVKIAANANSGSYSVRLRDNTNTSVTTTDNLALAEYESASVQFHYYPWSMETNEDFWLQVSTNGGASFTTVGSWKRGTDFNNGTHYDEIVGIDGPFTNTTKFRFRCDASGNGDYVYIDDINIRLCDNSSGLQGEHALETRELEREIVLFPNPVKSTDRLHVSSSSAEETLQVHILDMNGSLLKTIDWPGGQEEIQINLEYMPTGTYNVQLISVSGMETHKLVVVE